ncbi:Phosphoglycerate mutase [Phaffia rhodozyma]|uniref:Phosphoglycerate mutase n=1 Tax=Phaffia rhodozyma TaxID=264483 RepID=A0A0F7STF6_PHARH|nr:Phosphoglycerate mutase [Phaffia rhodozyma]
MADLIVHLIRHGQTDDNANKIIQGQKDTPLNQAGIHQASLLASNAFAPSVIDGWSYVWSSDLMRAAQTAKILLSASATPPTLMTTPRLRERYMSSLQGLEISALSSRPMPANAETVPQMQARGLAFWKDEILSLAEKANGDTVALVSHGAFRLLSLPPDIHPALLPNTSVTTLHLNRQGLGVLKTWADVSHLVGHGPTETLDSRLLNLCGGE